MIVGVPKETVSGESRVAVTPDVVKRLVAKGLAVHLETGAGAGAHLPDEEFREVGAELVDRDAALGADIVLKVRRLDKQEVGKLKSGAVLISLLEMCEDDGTLEALRQAGVRAFALERVPRITRAQSMDVLSSQSNIAGYRAVLEAAVHFGRFFPMFMTAAGSAKPARVVVLGAGVAGLQAIATARRLGADVHAYDVRPETREQIASLGAKPIELDIGESGSGEGGYAKELSEEGKARQQQLLTEELGRAHVIVSTAMIPCRTAPVLITEEAVKAMRAGSVIVDLAAATGGNCELTEADKVVTRHDVTIVGVTNYPAMVPTDASTFFSRNLLSFLDIVVEKQDEGLVFKDFAQDEITAAALVTG